MKFCVWKLEYFDQKWVHKVYFDSVSAQDAYCKKLEENASAVLYMRVFDSYENGGEWTTC